MDSLVSQTLAQLTVLPEATRHQIGMALLSGEGESSLPVIEFCDPALDRPSDSTDTDPA